CLVARIERHKAIIKLPSQAVFGLKLERYKAIKYMAERLSALPKYELKLTRYQDLGIYLRYILFGTLSRPEDYSTTRDSIKKYNQPEEQPGEHYEDLDAPLLALIAQKAKAIFDRFKLDFVTRMPTAEETLLRPATDIAKMYWTEDNWRRVVRPNFKLIFQHVTKSKLKWP
ncbi:hypothetical protein LPJ77_006066, partial [Coemansia sp. RSA 2523]